MIRVTRINHQQIVLNCDLIQSVETVPDTMIALINGQKLFVEESVEEIVERVVEIGDPPAHASMPHPLLDADHPSHRRGPQGEHDRRMARRDPARKTSART